MDLFSRAGIALSVFLSLVCLFSPSPSSHCSAAAAASFFLLSLTFRCCILKRKLTKHLMLDHDEEDAESRAQGQPRGLGSIAVALKTKRFAPAIDKCRGPDQAKSELTTYQTSEASIYGSDSEDWRSLSSYSSDSDGEDAEGRIATSLPFHGGDHTDLRQQIRQKGKDAWNDNEEDSLIELDISAGFIKTTREDEQSTSI